MFFEATSNLIGSTKAHFAGIFYLSIFTLISKTPYVKGYSTLGSETMSINFDEKHYCKYSPSSIFSN